MPTKLVKRYLRGNKAIRTKIRLVKTGELTIGFVCISNVIVVVVVVVVVILTRIIKSVVTAITRYQVFILALQQIHRRTVCR